MLLVLLMAAHANLSAHLNGTLTARTTDSITVVVGRGGATALRVTCATRFQNAPRVGDKVFVEGESDAQGKLTARKVVRLTHLAQSRAPRGAPRPPPLRRRRP